MSISRFFAATSKMANDIGARVKKITDKPFYGYNMYTGKYEATTVGHVMIGAAGTGIVYGIGGAYFMYADKKQHKTPVATTQPTYKSPRIG
ncbi:hypothetical protein AYO45_05945 [Gammaproteobacteria bacterium SCGC AG-212-F23]|nr:hypothetical protein AYO45_05945 [Gammaproteobacteria bacterium SCGC AG-212-F23]